MWKKIFYLFEVPPLKSYYVRYEVDFLINAGYEVTFLDVSKIINPSFLANTRAENLLENNYPISVYHFNQLKDIKNFLQKQNEFFIWSTVPFFGGSFLLFSIISKYDYGFIANIDYVPVSFNKEKKINYRDINFKKIFNLLLYMIPKRIIPLKKSKIVIIYSSEIQKQLLNNTLFNKLTLIDYTNTLDYLECKRCENELRIVEQKYILFLDQYLPFHPDGQKIGISINPNTYYQQIELFLDKIANYYSAKVVIAAHPKADYAKKKYFKKYEIIQYRTNILVRDAEIIISHNSLSLYYAFFYKKTFLVVTLDELEKNTYLRDSYKQLCNILGCSIYNISYFKYDLSDVIKKESKICMEINNRIEKKIKLPMDFENSKLSFGEVIVNSMKKV